MNEIDRVRRDHGVDHHPDLVVDLASEALRDLELLSVVRDRARWPAGVVLRGKEEVGAAGGVEAACGRNAFSGRRQMTVVIDDRKVGGERHGVRPGAQRAS